MKKWIAGISAAVLAFTGVASAVPGAVVTAADSNSKYNSRADDRRKNGSGVPIREITEKWKRKGIA